MKIVLLAASRVGSKTSTAIRTTHELILKRYPDADLTLIDLKEVTIEFSDGRNYLDYKGDTAFVTKALMDADILFIGTPTFQASIPGTLKNIFDLLPPKAFFRKTVSLIVTAGSAKHYLMAETQLKPILTYMKANLLPNYVFIEDLDFAGPTIVNDDVLFRLDTLVEDTFVLAETYRSIWEAQEASYDF